MTQQEFAKTTWATLKQRWPHLGDIEDQDAPLVIIEQCLEAYFLQIPDPTPKETIPPALEDVAAYFQEIGITQSTAQNFLDYYDNCRWQIKKGIKMTSWRGAARTWRSRETLAPRGFNKRASFA